MVVNPTSKLVYVANGGSNTVSVIEATTNTVAITIPVGIIGPDAAAITPDGATLYIANGPERDRDLTVAVVHTPTNTVIKTIDVAPAALPVLGLQMAMSPDGTKVYVADGGLFTGVLLVIDTATNLVSSTIKINVPPGWNTATPGGVVFSSSGRFAYVTSNANRSSGKVRFFVSKINTTTEQQINATGPFNIGGRGWGSIYRHMLYITDGNGVAVFDASSNMIVKRVPVGGYVMADVVTPDGKYLYVPYFPDKVATINTATYQLVGSPIQVGQDPSAVAIAPDGLRAYVTNNGDGTVSVIDISTR